MTSIDHLTAQATKEYVRWWRTRSVTDLNASPSRMYAVLLQRIALRYGINNTEIVNGTGGYHWLKHGNKNYALGNPRGVVDIRHLKFFARSRRKGFMPVQEMIGKPVPEEEVAAIRKKLMTKRNEKRMATMLSKSDPENMVRSLAEIVEGRKAGTIRRIRRRINAVGNRRY